MSPNGDRDMLHWKSGEGQGVGRLQRREMRGWEEGYTKLTGSHAKKEIHFARMQNFLQLKKHTGGNH